MATIESAITAALAGATGVSALVGNRVFPSGGRQGAAYPYVTWQRISTQGAAHLDGPSDLDWPRFQIDAWADTALQALEVADAIRAALDGIEQTTDPAFYGTFQDQRGPTPDAETRKFGVSQDYFIWYGRT